jgi:hypothetical protein
MNSENPSWNRLVALARQARDDRPVTAPYGFATRVVARAMSGEIHSGVNLFERWSWRALAIAGMFAAVSVAANYTSLTAPVDDEFLSDEQALAALFD